jgi:hypothetical protein
MLGQNKRNIYFLFSLGRKKGNEKRIDNVYGKGKR